MERVPWALRGSRASCSGRQKASRTTPKAEVWEVDVANATPFLSNNELAHGPPIVAHRISWKICYSASAV